MKHFNYYKLYNKLQWLYTLLPYYFGRGRALPPLRYNLHPTIRCNLSCPFCFIGNRLDCEELTTAEWLEFIDRIPRFSLISYSGGEVTLRPDFKAILKRSMERARTTFLTNGTFDDDELIDLIVENKLFLVGFSIDGIGGHHDDVRGMDGAFDRAVRNIEAIQRRKGGRRHPLVDIKTVILNDNMDELIDVYKLADSLKANMFTLSFLKGCTLQFNPVLEDTFSAKYYEKEYDPHRYFDLHRFQRAYRELLDFSKHTATQFRFYPEFASTRGEAELSKIESFYDGEGPKRPRDIYHKCLFPWTELSVTASGDCFPCLSYRVGNIKDGGTKKVWNGPKYVEFRKRIRKAGLLPSCQGCCYSRMK